MIDNFNNSILDFGPTESKNIIKVIGVGGGGGNAVNNMYKKGIHDVDFVLCNTDAQALNDSPVPVRIQLGKEGLGAGNRPEKAKLAAEESKEAIKAMLANDTKMAFITAGMGGGTGTGAAPVVARISKELGILTVGIVTIPFEFEGHNKITQALEGVENMAKNVDALLVVNNERLLKIYPDLSVLNAFEKADDTLTTAAKSIAEIITIHGKINLDFNDVKTVLEDGGVAIMSTGYGTGDGRVSKAIEDALNSPLLSNNDVYNSKKVLLQIISNDAEGKGLMVDEITEINNFMAKFHTNYQIKWGMAFDPELGDNVKITILATGFGISDIDGMDKRLEEKKNQQSIEDQEKQDRLNELKQSYYGDGKANNETIHNYKVFRFGPDDLDNEEIIMAVEDSPTFSRSYQSLQEIKNLSKANVKKVEPAEPAAPEDLQQVISFL
jgi:cell division protein FtsZ